MGALLFIIAIAVIFIIGKSIHDADDEKESYRPSGENYWDKQIRENRQKQMEAKSEANRQPEVVCHPQEVQETVIEYVAVRTRTTTYKSEESHDTIEYKE